MSAPVVAVAKVLGPRAAKALKRYGPVLWTTVQKSPQGQRLMERVGDRQGHRRNQIQAQLDLAKRAASDELAEQALPERQQQCRTWLRSLKVQELALRAAENQVRSVAKARRAEVAKATDDILTEIIETIGKWNETP